MIEASSSLLHAGLLGRVLDWVKARCGAPDELAVLSREELRELVADLSLGEQDLVSLTSGLHDNTVLMERMIRAQGFDPEHVRNAFDLLLRDMALVCSRCRSTRRCLRELNAGTAAIHAHEYCPNAGTFDDLLDYTTSG